MFLSHRGVTCAYSQPRGRETLGCAVNTLNHMELMITGFMSTSNSLDFHVSMQVLVHGSKQVHARIYAVNVRLLYSLSISTSEVFSWVNCSTMIFQARESFLMRYQSYPFVCISYCTTMSRSKEFLHCHWDTTVLLLLLEAYL